MFLVKLKTVFFSGFRECLFVLIEGVVVLRQLFLNRLDALDQQLQLGLLLCFFLLRYLHDFFQLVGVGLGQVEGQLCTGRANQFVQNAGSQNNGLQNIAGLAAEVRAPIAARPMATPSCGIRARPR